MLQRRCRQVLAWSRRMRSSRSTSVSDAHTGFGPAGRRWTVRVYRAGRTRIRRALLRLYVTTHHASPLPFIQQFLSCTGSARPDCTRYCDRSCRSQLPWQSGRAEGTRVQRTIGEHYQMLPSGRYLDDKPLGRQHLMGRGFLVALCSPVGRDALHLFPTDSVGDPLSPPSPHY